MKPKKLLPFVVIAAVLAALALLKNWREKPVSIVEQTKLQALVPSDLKKDTVTRLEFFAAGKEGEKVTLEKAADGWQVASQFNAPIKQDVLDGFLDKLLEMKGETRDRPETDERFATYSLKEDQAFRVRAYKSGAAEPALDLLVGKAPSATTVFVRKAGDKTVYVESFSPRREAGLFGEDLTESPKADKWLNKEIVALDREKIAKLAVTTPDKNLVLEKKTVEVPAPTPTEGEPAEGETTPPATQTQVVWSVTANGVEKPHKETGINTVLGKFTSLNAVTVVDPAKLADWGLENPGFKLTLSLDGESDTVIEGGRPDPAGSGYVRVASKGTNVVYELSKINFDGIFVKGSDLFDLPKADLVQTDINRIEINQPEGRVVLARNGTDWTVEEPRLDLEVQTSAITGLTGTIARLTPADYSDAAIDDANFTRSITATAGDVTRTVRVGGAAASSEGSYARLDSAPETLIITAADVKKLFLTPKEVYNLRVTTISSQEASGIEITENGEVFALRKDGFSWYLTQGGEPGEVTASDAEAFLATLASLTFADIHPGEAPVADPALSIRVRKADGGALALAIGPEADGKRRVSIAGKSIPFSVESDELNKLTAHFATLKTTIPGSAPAPTPAPVPVEVQTPAEAPMEEATPPAMDEAPAPAIPAEAAAIVEETPMAEPAPEAAPAPEPTESPAAPAEAPTVPVETPAEPAPAAPEAAETAPESAPAAEVPAAETAPAAPTPPAAEVLPTPEPAPAL